MHPEKRGALQPSIGEYDPVTLVQPSKVSEVMLADINKNIKKNEKYKLLIDLKK